MIKGKNIFAMRKGQLSIEEMLTCMGVDPTPELVTEAMEKLGPIFSMVDIGDFLREKGIITGSVVDVR